MPDAASTPGRVEPRSIRPARTLMIQGTASSVGKSLLVAALCRILRQDGWSVAPFKAQNMALESAVTPDGLEIGRAQAVQAEAAGIEPCVEMNPILLKPEGRGRTHVVVSGRPAGALASRSYSERRPELEAVIERSLATLRARHDVVVIEGAGSPAEINLADRDLVNMHVAHLAAAPVLLVGDIDLGGVFASLVGTWELLQPHDRARLAGLVINKLRGDADGLAPGLEILERRLGLPVLGVVPYVHDLGLADEDAVVLDGRRGRRRAGATEVEVAVVRLPRISNSNDLVPLEREAGVVVRYVDRPGELDGADLVVLPGSKASALDLGWLRERGLDAPIRERAAAGLPVLGICGGCQMLGERLLDPDGVESPQPEVEGLGLLPLVTTFAAAKVTARVKARPRGGRLGFLGELPGLVDGYEIHMGVVERRDGAGRPAFDLVSRNGEPGDVEDGAVSADGAVVGTLVHGLLDNDPVRGALLDSLRRRKGLAPRPVASPVASLEDPADRDPDRDRTPAAADPYDRLAAVVREALDLEALYRVAGLSERGPGRG